MILSNTHTAPKKLIWAIQRCVLSVMNPQILYWNNMCSVKKGVLDFISIQYRFWWFICRIHISKYLLFFPPLNYSKNHVKKKTNVQQCQCSWWTDIYFTSHPFTINIHWTITFLKELKIMQKIIKAYLWLWKYFWIPEKKEKTISPIY